MKVFEFENKIILKLKSPQVQILMQFNPIGEETQIDVDCLRACSHDCQKCELLRLCLVLDLNDLLNLP